MDHLLFQLYAPLVSWGSQAVGQERPTDNHLSRSALLGLLAAALGIDRQDQARHQALSDSIAFGVKQLSAGLIVRDFHTMQVPSEGRKTDHLQTRKDALAADKVGTMLSFRSYQQDALSIVAVWLTEEASYTLEQLQSALRQPHFQLYLGRKSCPLACPMLPVITHCASLKVALDDYQKAFKTPWNDLLRLENVAPGYYWQQHPNAGLKAQMEVTRADQPLNRPRWQFGPRIEYMCSEGAA